MKRQTLDEARDRLNAVLRKKTLASGVLNIVDDFHIRQIDERTHRGYPGVSRSPQRTRDLLAGIRLALAANVVVTLIAVALIWTGLRPQPAVAQPCAPVGIAPVALRTRA